MRRGDGVHSEGRGTRFINLIVHDMRNGIGLWRNALGGELYGSIIFHNGYDAADRGHGHGIYTQNEGGNRRIVDNIFFSGFGAGIHAYGSSAAALDNMHLLGNIIANSGALSPRGNAAIVVGGGVLARDPVATDNYVYTALKRGSIHFGWDVGCTNLAATGNYFALLGTYPLVLEKCDGVIKNNTLLGFVSDQQMARYPQNQYGTAPPTVNQVFVRPNQYERGRAHVAVYNWTRSPSVSVDLSAAGLELQQGFEIRDAQNFYAPPVVRGVFTGSPVLIPMQGLQPMQPVGNTTLPPKHSAPEFGTFVVLPTGSSTPDPAASADLALTLEPLPTEIGENTPISYTLRVLNNGPAASDVTLAVSATGTGSLQSFVPSIGTCASDTCSFGNLAPQATASLSVSFVPTAAGSVAFSAHVSGSAPDGNGNNNQVGAVTSVTAAVGAQSDVAIQQTLPEHATVGAPFPVSLTLSNKGPNPSNVTSAIVFTGAAKVTGVSTAACKTGGLTVQCAFGSLSAGTSLTFTVTVEATSIGTVQSTATATGSAPDPVSVNNTSSGSVQAVAATAADLAVSQTATPATIVLGENATFLVRVINNGPGTAQGVTLSNQIPWRTSLVSAVPSRGSCQQSTCALGTIAPGTSVTVTVTVKPTTTGQFVNRGNVASSPADSTAGNNTSAAAITVVNSAIDLSVSVTSSSAAPIAGTPFSYLVRVTNAGPRAAPSVTLTGSFPPLLQVVGATTASGSCTGTSALTCALGTIEPSAVATVTVTVLPISTGSISTTFRALSAIADNVVDNVATSNLNVGRSAADLSVTQVAHWDNGRGVFTTEVLNAGPATAALVQVTNELPWRSQLVSASTTHGSCSGPTCSIGTMAAGSRVRVVVVVQLSSVGTSTNVSRVSGAVDDPIPSNNSAAATATAP
jgi:uncharacterized repeat protein (TIGR01451 family)